MRPTEILSSEHLVILRVLACLERMIEAALEEGRLDGERARSAVDFLRTFADGCHHGKEEERLFPRLVELGLPAHNGPIAVMLAEHEEGRAHVRAMAQNLVGAAEGDVTALETFGSRGRSFAALLRQHIDKEDHILFPLAERMIPEATVHGVLEEFEEADRSHPAGTHERMLAVAESLGEHYGVPAFAGPPGLSSPTGSRRAHHGVC